MIAALFAVLGVIVWWSCGTSVYHNYRATRSAVEQFHQYLDGADYESIYKQTSAAFRSASPHEDEIRFFENVHRKMGKCGATTATGFYINSRDGYVFVNQSFNTQFTQGQAQEAFVWLMDNGQPLLQMYRIDAPQLH